MRGGGKDALTSRTYELKYPRMAVTSPLVIPLFLKESKPLRVVGSSSSPSCRQKTRHKRNDAQRHVSTTVNNIENSMFRGSSTRGVPHTSRLYIP